MVAEIILTPANGPVGTVITIDGTGFTPLDDVTFTYGGSPIATTPATVTCDGSGVFQCTVTVPDSTAGIHAIVATDETLLTDSADFTVESQITLTPNSGNVGDSVTVDGTGFAASEDITIDFDSSPIATTPMTVTTDVNGTFTGDIVIPASVEGAHTVDATDVSMNTDGATFTVIPEILLSPTNGIVGSSTTVTGTGFDASSATTIDFAGTDVTGAALTTDSNGGFSRAITVPEKPNGARVVTATDAGANNDTANFTVDAKLVITPTTGPVGTTVTVDGTGFSASEAITIDFDMTDITPMAGINSNADGTFTGEVIIPDAVQGAHTVDATDVSMVTDDESFTVETQITLDDSSGVIGQEVTITGTGFAASEDVTFTIEMDALTTDPVTVTTDVDGGLTCTFDVPTGYDGVVEIIGTDKSMNSDEVNFTIILADETTINVSYSKLNGPNYNMRSVDQATSRERGCVVDIAFSADDRYTTGGIPIDFSTIGAFTQVYLCIIAHNGIGLNTSFVPGAGNDSSLGKIKIWGTDGNELADNSNAVASKSLRMLIRGI